MENWEIALQKFVKKWEKKKEVIGMIVCGSYILGNPTKHSDIDIQIILDKNTSWGERGNEIIDGILIEYFANTSAQHLEYYKKDYNIRRKIKIHMFMTGKILFDKTGELKYLVNEAKKQYKKPFLKINKSSIEMIKYHLWDMQDNLEEIFEANTDEFYLTYYVYLNILIDKYSSYLGFEELQVHKLRRFLAEKKDKIKYDVQEFPDKKFVKTYLNAIKLKDKTQMLKEYQDLTKHILTKMGGLDLTNWKCRKKIK